MDLFASFSTFLSSFLLVSFVCGIVIALTDGTRASGALRFACSLVTLSMIASGICLLFSSFSGAHILSDTNVSSFLFSVDGSDSSDDADYSAYKELLSKEAGKLGAQRLCTLIEEKFGLTDNDISIELDTCASGDDIGIDAVLVKIRSIKALSKEGKIENYVKELGEFEKVIITEDFSHVK